MIKPTVGRVVWFYPTGSDEADQPFPALIAHVHGDRCVNLAIFDSNGVPMSQPPTSISLVQDGDAIPKLVGGKLAMHCRWMPYQIGQAKAHAPAAS